MVTGDKREACSGRQAPNPLRLPVLVLTGNPAEIDAVLARMAPGSMLSETALGRTVFLSGCTREMETFVQERVRGPL